MATLTCPSCSHKFSVPDWLNEIKCPKCRTPVGRAAAGGPTAPPKKVEPEPVVPPTVPPQSAPLIRRQGVMRGANWRKVAAFGLLGAAGCLAGWVLGEGLMAFTNRVQKPRSPSLVSTPTNTAVPTSPLTPEPPRRAPPPPPPPELARRLEREGAHAGEIEISLYWHNYNDLDLHCIDPTGFEIHFASKKSPSGGWLDVDMNALGRLGVLIGHSSSTPVEHIRWAAGGCPIGHYRVYVHHYATHGGTDPTSYKVDVLANGERKEFSGTISHGDPPILVHQFEVGPALRMALPSELAVNPGGTNHMSVRIARDRCSGPVAIKFVGDLEGLAFGPHPDVLQGATIPDGESSALIVIAADGSARPGPRQLQVIAQAGVARAEGILPVTVQPIAPSVQLAVPGELPLRRGQDSPMTVRVVRNRFDGPVKITFAGDLDGISLAELVIPSGETERTVTIRGARTAREGSREIRATATGGAARTEIKFQLTVVPSWSWRELLVTAAWTSMLAIGLSLALVMGQNRYLGRPLLSSSQLLMVLGGGIAAGFAAGGTGQALFGLLSQANLLPTAGFLAGWLLLGGLLGWGVGLFVPNLKTGRAGVAGAVGGFLGALPFFMIAGAEGDAIGRFLGAAILGLAIGLMVALVEAAFREAWLEIHYDREGTRTVSLGSQPVTIGSGPGCTVYVASAAPVALRYLLQNGQILCAKGDSGTPRPVPPGKEEMIGQIRVVPQAPVAVTTGSNQ